MPTTHNPSSVTAPELATTITRLLRLFLFVVLFQNSVAIGQTTPEITSPAAGSIASAGSIQLDWAGNDVADDVIRYFIYAGSAPGESDYYRRNQGTNTSGLVTGLPTDGSTVYVQLWYFTDAGWQSSEPVSYVTENQILPAIVSPDAGADATNGTLQVTWDANDVEEDIIRYTLFAGSTPGGDDYFRKGQGLNTTGLITGLPTDGSTVYVQLWYFTAAGWQSTEPVSYVTANQLLPAIVSPVAGSTASNGALQLTWDGNDVEEDVIRYTLFAGSTPGGDDYYRKGQGLNTSAMVTGLPTDGSSVYFQLWYFTQTGWQPTEPVSFETANQILPAIVLPDAGSTSTAGALQVTWDGNDVENDIIRYTLFAGSTPGGDDYYRRGQGLNTTTYVTGLPTDGSTFYIQLWYFTEAGWQSTEPVSYVTANQILPAIVSPDAGTTAANGTLHLTWDGNDIEADIIRYTLLAGSTPGGDDYFRVGQGTNTAGIVTGLPNDGSTVYVQLAYETAAGWLSAEPVVYMANTVTPPTLNTPAPGDTLVSGTASLSWSANDLSGEILEYRVIAGASEGGSELYDQNLQLSQSATVSGLPTDGSKIYFELSYRTSQGWFSLPAVEVTSASIVREPNLDNFKLVFNDEFNGTALDSSKWHTGLLWGPYQPINNEEQLYVDTLGINQGFEHSPFEFTGDSLKIVAIPTTAELQPPVRPDEDDPVWDDYREYRFNGPSANGPGYQPTDVNYLSGIITSYDAFKMTHGYVEARAKLPAGRGLWPAFWMLNTHYVEDSPEIDVMEFLGQNTDTLYHTYHYFEPQNGYRQISTPTLETIGPDWTNNFHTFGMEWSPKEIVWYVDGVETHRIDNTEYTITGQAMYLLANLAVGGNWPGSPDADTVFPAEYEIDYIRAYKKELAEPINLAADFQMMFNDEFDSGTLDEEKWNTSFLWGPYIAINNEEQYYVDSNNTDKDKGYSPFSFHTEGATSYMSINARTAADSGDNLPPTQLPSPNDPIWSDNRSFQQGPYVEQDYTSGIITSYDAFKFVNGYAEIRARVPEGDGLWPAFWLLNAYYVGPSPEIDIMEILGEDTSTAYHTYHRHLEHGILHSDQITSESPAGSTGYSDNFHTFGAHWQPGKITWYVDGNVVGTYEENDPNNPNRNDAYQLMYVIANLAVGGNFNSEAVDPAAIPASYDIDYIRVYQEKP